MNLFHLVALVETTRKGIKQNNMKLTKKKAGRVECSDCKYFIPPILKDENNMFSDIETNARCEIGKRVMFRKPKGRYPYLTDYGYIRYCNEFDKKL